MAMMKIKKRIEQPANYSSVFFGGKTLRIPLNASKPITELRFPEFYDVSFGNKCRGGCKFCYASASKSGINYKNIAQKLQDFFGQMTENQRPTQTACGGESDSLENPECWEAMEVMHDLGIVPNITTNGILIDEKNTALIKKFCGGAAVSVYNHTTKHWKRAVSMLSEAKIKLNLHIIVSDKKSVASLRKLYTEFVRDNNMVEYLVLLPYMNVGLAANNPKQIDFDGLSKFLDEVYSEGRLAFGANFYPYLKDNKEKYNVGIYPPEIFSKYLVLNDDMEVFNNSFSRTKVPFNHETGCELGHSRVSFEIP